jgi:2-polyprenyl-3-methyl-5-hydroxy-6-metoxy-1,4-benzoquinol methylase
MCAVDVRTRALQSQGASSQAILRMLQRTLEQHQISGKLCVDVGCGAGNAYPYVRSRFNRYIGIDVVRYETFPDEADFYQFDLDGGSAPLPDECADVVMAIEVIEHLENPRDFMRKLVRIAKPSGWVIVTTPNQLSMLSLLTLLVKQQFQAFQDGSYPAHLTALLEVDLKRISMECGLTATTIDYSLNGRIPLTAKHYPRRFARLFPRFLSDNVLLIGRKIHV